MRKKTFYQTGIFWQLLCLMMLAISLFLFIFGIIVCIRTINYFVIETAADVIISIIPTTLCLSVAIFFFLEFVRMEHNNIHFTSEKLYINDDWLREKHGKIQYYTEVKFIDIESVDIIWTENNSQGRPMRASVFLHRSCIIPTSVFMPKPYLSITTKEVEKKNFFIMYFPQKSILKIINEIRVRMKIVGNDSNIITDDEALLKLNQ